jgi:UDP-N-acetyl-D-glucosamine/UDP-N-acetyl-D-galactosamine dehydrogenase
MEAMLKKINKICVVGLGYVGLPLATTFSEKFLVVGFDSDQERINELNTGYDRTGEIEKNALLKLGNITYTANIKEVKNCDTYIITVPTPVDSLNKPDLTAIMNATRSIGSIIKKGDIVIYESTVYPGVTEEICAIELEKISGLKFNKDFYCGYSPERINPGDRTRTIKEIIKITSGSTPEIGRLIDKLYKTIITAGTCLVSNIRTAEASKVIENTQRDVNIALVNELAMIFDRMGIDTNEVLQAAATKWNFAKYIPGLVGGHCIGIDPYYLTYKAEALGYKPNLILAARKINNSVPKFIVESTIKNMIKANKLIKGASVLILGMTFKENCPDTRNSKVFDIIEELKEFETHVDVYDPYVTRKIDSDDSRYKLVKDPINNQKKYDAIIVAVAHEQFKKYTMNDFAHISKNELVLIDVKGITPRPTWKL